jgi:hypothetical protein
VATILERSFYNAKGELTQKRLAPRDAAPFNGNGLQHVDYGYLPNGLLDNINGRASLSNSSFKLATMLSNFNMPSFTSTTNEDLFREVLNYATLESGQGTVQRNGNIAQVHWQVKGREKQGYGLTYDYLNRLTNAQYNDFPNEGGATVSAYFDESQGYDSRGNITSLTRRGLVKGSTAYSSQNIDVLNLAYTAGTNRIAQITDSGNQTVGFRKSNSTSPYTYDTNGNLTFDPDKNLTITSFHHNLPKTISFSGNNSLEFWYDAMGNKVRKIVKTAGTTTLTHDYLGGIEVKNNKVEAIYNEAGRAFNTATSGQAYRYEYYLKDHLGNIRLSFTDKNNDGLINNQGEVLLENH